MTSVYNNFSSIDNVFLKVSIILVCLVPFGMALGGFFPEVFLLLSFLFVFKDIYKQKNKYFKKRFIFFFLIFYLYILSNSFFKNFDYFPTFKEYLIDQKSIIFFFRYSFYFILIWYLFDVLKSFKKIFFKTILVTISLIGLDALYQYFNGVNLVGLSRINEHRLSGIFNDEYILGSYLLRLYFVLLPLYLFFFELKEKKYQYIYLLINLFFFILIFLSGERTAFYLFLITLIISFIILKEINLTIIFQAFIVFVVTIFFTISADTKIEQRMIYTTYDDFFNKNTKKVYFFTKIHHDHYMSAKLMLKDNFLTGIGARMFKYECNKSKYSYYKNRCENHPHNYYVQIFSETGILGGIFILLLLVVVFFNFMFLFFKSKSNLNYNKILIVSFVILIFPLAPHANFFNNWIIILNLLPLSLYYHFKYSTFK